MDHQIPELENDIFQDVSEKKIVKDVEAEKEKHRERMKKWRAENIERNRELNKRHLKVHREKVKAKKHEYAELKISHESLKKEVEELRLKLKQLYENPQTKTKEATHEFL